MVAGRPQEWDVDFLADELLIWARLPNSLNINGFCISLVPEIDPEYFRALVRKHPSLSQAFRIAKAHLALRREEAHSEKLLSDKAFCINVKHYDTFVKFDILDEEIQAEKRQHDSKLALIDHQAKQEQAKLISPYEEIHELKHKSMILEDENRKLRERLADKH
jgi:hypothetical protein